MPPLPSHREWANRILQNIEAQIEGMNDDDLALLREHISPSLKSRLAAIIDRLSSAPSRGSDSDEPACPHCARPLQEVRYEGGYLNEDQFDSIRAGDWFCEQCPGWPKRYRYFWNRDLAPLVTESAGGQKP
jgi:hypothetical protein